MWWQVCKVRIFGERGDVSVRSKLSLGKGEKLHTNKGLVRAGTTTSYMSSGSNNNTATGPGELAAYVAAEVYNQCLLKLAKHLRRVL